MRSFSFLLTRVGMLAALLGLSRVGHAETITTFDVPHAADTFPEAINVFGQIAGSYRDESFAQHGFVRTPFGAITTFDAPTVGDSSGFGTEVTAINAAGQIVGTAFGASANVLAERGFVREPNGMITEFDAVLGAITTKAQTINPEGSVAGIYFDAGFVSHGYVRSAHGAITSFDVPGLITAVRDIRPNGAVIGLYLDSIGVYRGFVREPSGTLTSFEAPGVNPTSGGVGCGHCSGTFAAAANTAGRTVGYYGDAVGVIHGFLRKPNGVFSILDVPGATQTLPLAINLDGNVAGEYLDGTPVTHGFVLLRHGALESFDVAGSNNLSVTGVGPDSEVIGSYGDSSGTVHGFIRRPRAACGHSAERD